MSDLTEFLLACTQSGLSLALEVRHLDWFKPKQREHLNTLLTELKIAKVLLDTRPIYNCPDHPQIGSPRKKPKLPLQQEIIGDRGFVRFISHPEEKYNQTYLKQWVHCLNTWLNQGKTIYFFVHCPQEARSPDTAKYFYSLIQENNRNANFPTLPWNDLEPNPTQLSLF